MVISTSNKQTPVYTDVKKTAGAGKTRKVAIQYGNNPKGVVTAKTKKLALAANIQGFITDNYLKAVYEGKAPFDKTQQRMISEVKSGLNEFSGVEQAEIDALDKRQLSKIYRSVGEVFAKISLYAEVASGSAMVYRKAIEGAKLGMSVDEMVSQLEDNAGEDFDYTVTPTSGKGVDIKDLL